MGIHHVGVAVHDIDDALATYLPLLGGNEPVLRRVLADQQVEAAALALGGQELELIAPHGESKALRAFLERRGEGLHHVAWEVRDVELALAAASAAGLRLIDSVPRPGLHGVPVAFLHPAGMNGVLTELVQTA
jgi:methylmalonyl-CoA epimerase